MKTRLIITVMLIASSLCSSATSDSTTHGNPIRDINLTAGVGGSYILPTNGFLKSVSGNSAMVSPDIRAAFRFSPSTRYGRLYPNVAQGIGLTWNAIVPNSAMGYPAGVFLFQDVRIFNSGRLSINAGWDFGITGPWRHFDPETNPDNTAIGSAANAMLGINLGARYKLSDRLSIGASLTATHYSNGNTKLPNSGVNTTGLRLGIIYTITKKRDISPCRAPLPDDFIKGLGYDLTLYGSTRRCIVQDGSGDHIIAPGSFGVAGLNLAPMYAFSRYIRAGVSVDLQYDESANLDRHLVDYTYGDEVRFYRQPFSERFAAGLSIRGELKLSIFSINAGIGRNIVAKGNLRAFYQTLTLKAYVFGNAYLQAGYQLHDFSEPNNLMLGVGYTFGRR